MDEARNKKEKCQANIEAYSSIALIDLQEDRQGWKEDGDDD